MALISTILGILVSIALAGTEPAITVDGNGNIEMRNIRVSTTAGGPSIFTISKDTDAVRFANRLEIKELEVLSPGIRSHGRGKFKGADIEIEDADRGLILTADDGTKWLLWVDNTGSLFTTQIAASPEVSMTIRRQRMAQKRQKMDAAKKRYKPTDTLMQRLEVIEELLGLRE